MAKALHGGRYVMTPMCQSLLAFLYGVTLHSPEHSGIERAWRPGGPCILLPKSFLITGVIGA
jgi:hypothetical protein